MSKPGNDIFKEVPLEIVGSTKFGRYPKISQEQTWNMLISDQWMVPFAGYESIQTIDNAGQGRTIFSDDKSSKMFVVVNDLVYYLDTDLSRIFIGNLQTSLGDVFIAANNVGQVAISDGRDIWIYQVTHIPMFYKALSGGMALDFKPGYITYQNGRFLVADLSSNAWRLSDVDDGSNFPFDAQHVGLIETKNDNAQAVVRVPGKGNQILVFGKTVTEVWYDVGAQLFPYQRSTNSNIDYGCLNAATIASSDKFVVWLGFNEKSGATIMMSDGGESQQISNDGINFQLAQLTNPANSFGFMFRQDGHVLYIITFPDDELSYMYDFNTQLFFNVSNPNLQAHIARHLAFFDNNYYFVSYQDGKLYQLSSEFLLGDGQEIPRIRICPPLRIPDQSRYIIANAGFTMEMGQINYDSRNTLFLLACEDFSYISTEDGIFDIGEGEDFTNIGLTPRVDLAKSKDGGVSFGSAYSRFLNPLGMRPNRCMWWRIGMSNDTTLQFRFYGTGRFVATNGLASIYQ